MSSEQNFFKVKHPASKIYYHVPIEYLGEVLKLGYESDCANKLLELLNSIHDKKEFSENQDTND